MDLKEKLFQKISGWKSKLLSHVGIITLIWAVVATVPAYPLSFFYMLQSFHRVLDKKMKDFFLWNSHPEKKHNMTLKAWQQICTPKCMGGLGLPMMHDVNLSFVAKLGWKLLINQKSLSGNFRQQNTWSMEICSQPLWERNGLGFGRVFYSLEI